MFFCKVIPHWLCEAYSLTGNVRLPRDLGKGKWWPLDHAGGEDPRVSSRGFKGALDVLVGCHRMLAKVGQNVCSQKCFFAHFTGLGTLQHNTSWAMTSAVLLSPELVRSFLEVKKPRAVKPGQFQRHGAGQRASMQICGNPMFDTPSSKHCADSALCLCFSLVISRHPPVKSIGLL